jgi:hypothetical protein
MATARAQGATSDSAEGSYLAVVASLRTSVLDHTKNDDYEDDDN